MDQRIKTIYKYIGFRIKTYRKLINITQADLAFKSNLQRPSITLIEKGQQMLPIDRLYLISNALNVCIYDLLPKKIICPKSIAKSLKKIKEENNIISKKQDQIKILKEEIKMTKFKINQLRES